jgi:transposase
LYIQRYKRTKKGKVYQSAFLVESFREEGKVKHKHLANLSSLPEHLLLVLEKELKNTKKEDSFSLKDLQASQGKCCGGIIAIQQLCKRLFIEKALGTSKEAKLALIQIMGRILCQGSRNYIANEWVASQAIEEILGVRPFTEDDLYSNLDWLAINQEKIEDKLFKMRHQGKIECVYLYDVTSSYFEGTENELASFGYNRDGKKGKMQIVVGLLCDHDGYPISVEVFKGNTQDASTVHAQLQKLKKRFGIEHVIMVGDRGMIKKAAIETITDFNWYYITAITKPQVETLIQANIIQLELFTDKLIEVEYEATRYVLRRNPSRAIELNLSRDSKLNKIQQLLNLKNEYLKEHPKAKVQTALKAINERIKKLKLSKWLTLLEQNRILSLNINQEILKEDAALDGCYVIKSNVPKELADQDQLHNRYKDLQMVEAAFRTMKQTFEELRPIYVRKEKRTKGHVFVCMLSYIVIKYASEQCKQLEYTRKHIFNTLDNIQYISYDHKNIQLKILPKKLLPQTQQIIEKLNIKLPTYL